MSESVGGPGMPGRALYRANPTEFAPAPLASGVPTVTSGEACEGELQDAKASGGPCTRSGVRAFLVRAVRARRGSGLLRGARVPPRSDRDGLPVGPPLIRRRIGHVELVRLAVAKADEHLAVPGDPARMPNARQWGARTPATSSVGWVVTSPGTPPLRRHGPDVVIPGPVCREGDPATAHSWSSRSSGLDPKPRSGSRSSPRCRLRGSCRSPSLPSRLLVNAILPTSKVASPTWAGCRSRCWT